MAIESKHVTGFVIGVGVSALAFYLYKKNQTKVDDWLRSQGIELPSSSGGNPTDMSLEELVSEKEKLEDLIAEREMATRAQGAEVAG